MLFGAMQRSQKLILPTVAGERPRKRESETESSRKVTHTVRHPAKLEPFLNCVIQQLMSWFRWFQRSYAPQLWPCIHCDTWTCRIADMEVYLSSVLPKIQFTSKRVVKDVCVCACVCVCEKHLEHSCHPFENKGTRCYKPVQARVLPCYLWKNEECMD